MKNRHLLTAVVALSFLVLAVFQYIKQDNSDTLQPAEATASPAVNSTNSELDLQSSKSLPIEKKTLKGESEESEVHSIDPKVDLSPEEEAYLLAYHPRVLEVKIFKKDPFIKKFKDLSEKKVLLRTGEQAELKSLLTDRSAWKRYLKEFEKNLPIDDSYKEPEQHRMMMIDYFEKAVGEVEGSARKQLLSDLVDLLFYDNIVSSQPTHIKQSLAGEKVEILHLIARSSPVGVEMIRSHMARGSYQNVKLIRHYLEQL
ncbi:hypothetical protein [Pseudobacteriovorax antillogorgiicola]|nr:hypothetical protein [Pseudobacteriovorax antillogorgiicola]